MDSNDLHISAAKLCTCIGGLTSLDNGYGQPTYCEKCVIGLDLAMTALARNMMGLAEGEADRMERAKATGRGGNSFSLALRDENEKLAAQMGAEHDRLEALYVVLGGHSATATAAR